MRTQALLVFLVFLLLANFFIWQEVFKIDGKLEVVFFDIGQGDSIFIETPQGHQILIDGGPSDKVLEKLSQELPFYDRSLDLVVLSHPDYDHQRGLLDVLDRYKVDNILWTGILRETKTFERWLEKIGQEQSNIVIAEKGQRIEAGDSVIYILHPLESLEGIMMENSSNDSSIVAKLVFGSNTFLFLGDISNKQAEKMLPRSDLPVGLGADIIKVAHHGSKSSTDQSFVSLVNPEVAVISCGKDNNFGHPHPEVLSILEEFGITVLRTDLIGNIKIVADGSNFKLNL